MMTTGLQYNRARWYDPNLGRFISEDPIEFGGRDINWYSYVFNNPFSYFDPEGKQSRADARWDWSPDENRRMVRDIQRMPMPVGRPTAGLYHDPPQCGPAGHPFQEWLVPDSTGGFGGPFGRRDDLIPPCTAHDTCYSTCGRMKAFCDTQLGNDVRDVCLSNGGTLGECNFYGGAYYNGVDWLGKGAYQSAQEESGCIACLLPAPKPPDPCVNYGICK
jgi:hypothetical protein